MTQRRSTRLASSGAETAVDVASAMALVTGNAIALTAQWFGPPFLAGGLDALPCCRDAAELSTVAREREHHQPTGIPVAAGKVSNPAAYQRTTDREIPVFVAEPTG